MFTATQTRITSFSFAALLTLAMLAGVNGLATSDVPAAQMARMAATQQA
jgi:hypothetical protein